MRQWKRRWAAIAASVVACASLPVTALDSAAVSRADDGCGAGMYYDTDTESCEPWAAPPAVVVVNPVPVPIPNFSACASVTGRRGHVSAGGCVG